MLKEVEALAESIRKHGPDPEFMERMETRVRHSGILVDGKQYVPYSAIPVFFNDDDMEFLNRNTRILYSILSKMTNEYIRSPQYRKIFGFSPDMEELITLPCNYGEMFPVMRYDIFLFPDSGDFQLCEINTDGTSGFDLDCRVSGALIDTYSESGGQYDLPPHMDNFHTAGTLADSLIRIYFSSENPVAKPTFALVDFTEEACCGDFREMIDTLKGKGYDARFTDVRNLRFDGENLIDMTDGTVIDAIYRRLVTSVVLGKMDECRDLFEAIKAGKVVIMGHFRTSLAHSKSSFYAMRHPESRKLFDSTELDFIEKHIPKTYMMKASEIDDDLMKDILANRKKWITKPAEGFNSDRVISGETVDDNEWRDIIKARMDNGYIIQEFCPRYVSPTLSYQDTEIKGRCIMTGVMASGDKVIGFYNRAGDKSLIHYSEGGIIIPAVKV